MKCGEKPWELQRVLFRISEAEKKTTLSLELVGNFLLGLTFHTRKGSLCNTNTGKH